MPSGSGISHSPFTRALLDDFGFDVALDHYAEDFEARLSAACPDGIDVYFENVGGRVLAAVLPLLNQFARVPVCGLVAHYSGVRRCTGSIPCFHARYSGQEHNLSRLHQL
ncbi:zinc-binding dehydrogenase [Rhizorhapis suberifaciens]|uniref:zinc-binding dehydrogenase n=1 Tax=Rhizorhapis suberifaciens TaxID=13656 RepID=UPI001C85104B